MKTLVSEDSTYEQLGYFQPCLLAITVFAMREPDKYPQMYENTCVHVSDFALPREYPTQVLIRQNRHI